MDEVDGINALIQGLGIERKALSAMIGVSVHALNAVLDLETASRLVIDKLTELFETVRF